MGQHAELRREVWFLWASVAEAVEPLYRRLGYGKAIVDAKWRCIANARRAHRDIHRHEPQPNGSRNPDR